MSGNFPGVSTRSVHALRINNMFSELENARCADFSVLDVVQYNEHSMQMENAHRAHSRHSSSTELTQCAQYARQVLMRSARETQRPQFTNKIMNVDRNNAVYTVCTAGNWPEDAIQRAQYI